MPRLLPFTFCFLLFLLSSLSDFFACPDFSRPSPAARDRQTRQLRLDNSDQTAQTRQRPETRQRPSDPRPLPPILPTARTLVFLFYLLFAPLSLHQNRVSRAKSGPFTFEHNRSTDFFRASGKSRLITIMFKLLPERFWFHFGKGGGAD